MCAKGNSVAGGEFKKKESGAGALGGRGEVALKVRQEAMSLAEGAFGGKRLKQRCLCAS